MILILWFMSVKYMRFCFGIEHEVAFVNREGKFADFSQTKFIDFHQIVEELPTYPDDYSQLRVGDAGIRQKRWYIEGFERFENSDQVTDCIPKGIEIRTTIHSDIAGVIGELSESFALLRQTAAKYGFYPVLISFNPDKTAFTPQPPLNAYEIEQLRGSPDDNTANIYMVTYGPDLNISVPGLPTEKLIDIGKKLTYYSPYIIPFSYSSPFYDGELWTGLSVRTFVRTGKRAAALVFVGHKGEIIHTIPSLTKIARIPAEVGRIEFKACDSCDDFSIYGALLALFKGLILDDTLPERATVPDPFLHQLSAKEGFKNQEILNYATKILEVAEIALRDDPDIELLTPLRNILATGKTKSHELIEAYHNLGSIAAAMRQTYP